MGTPGFPSRLDETKVLTILDTYKDRRCTRQEAAERLGISESYFTRICRKHGVKVHGVGNVKPSRKHARALAQASLRDRAIVEILGGGCEQKAFALANDLSPTSVRTWLLAFKHELACPTAEADAPAEGHEHTNKDWAYHAVRRLKAEYPGAFD